MRKNSWKYASFSKWIDWLFRIFNILTVLHKAINICFTCKNAYSKNEQQIATNNSLISITHWYCWKKQYIYYTDFERISDVVCWWCISIIFVWRTRFVLFAFVAFVFVWAAIHIQFLEYICILVPNNITS